MIHRPRFLSYAQNREDVRLRRAFPRNDGFYIDVGAADPVEHSVTKALSLAGWRGINIEPQGYYYQRLVADRPRDINLNLGVSDQPGEMNFFESPSHRGFSTLDATVAATWSTRGIESKQVRVPTLTLAEVCRQHAPSAIDVLKIDVEGHERSVLLGADFHTYRPVVVMVEATIQNSTATNHDTWEFILRNADYRFAAFDGLNRYYVRAESATLIDAIAMPPNIFDDYGPADVWHHVDHLDRERIELRHAVEHLRESLAHAQLAASRSLTTKLKSLFRTKAA
jgi:FkbM family methyltransferase